MGLGGGVEPTIDWFEFDSLFTPSEIRSRRRSLEPSTNLGVAASASEYDGDRNLEVRYALPAQASPDHNEPPPWNIGFSKNFSKDLSGLDRKLAGRVLETLLIISNFAMPFVVLGDTFKPLSGKLASCWRYRIGDHRLILRPEPEDALIMAVAFAARGSIYE